MLLPMIGMRYSDCSSGHRLARTRPVRQGAISVQFSSVVDSAEVRSYISLIILNHCADASPTPRSSEIYMCGKRSKKKLRSYVIYDVGPLALTLWILSGTVSQWPSL